MYQGNLLSCEVIFRTKDTRFDRHWSCKITTKLFALRNCINSVNRLLCNLKQIKLFIFSKILTRIHRNLSTTRTIVITIFWIFDIIVTRILIIGYRQGTHKIQRFEIELFNILVLDLFQLKSHKNQTYTRN
mgnify:FL=1